MAGFGRTVLCVLPLAVMLVLPAFGQGEAPLLEFLGRATRFMTGGSGVGIYVFLCEDGKEIAVALPQKGAAPRRFSSYIGPRMRVTGCRQDGTWEGLPLYVDGDPTPAEAVGTETIMLANLEFTVFNEEHDFPDKTLLYQARRINAIGAHIVACGANREGELHYRFYLAVPADGRRYANAFALGKMADPESAEGYQGAIVVTADMVASADGDDELAFILAHEIGHVELHHEEGSYRGLDVAGLNQLVYSREKERLADARGMRLATLAGYAPQASVGYFRTLQSLPFLLQWASEHPVTTERIRNAQNLLSSHSLPAATARPVSTTPEALALVHPSGRHAPPSDDIPPAGSEDLGVGDLSSEMQHFVDCYLRNGAGAAVGRPADPDGMGHRGTRWWGSRSPVVVQYFEGGSEGGGAIIDNEGQAHGGAFWLHGEIWKKYLSVGGPDSALGRPGSDEFDAAPSPMGTRGRVSRFEHGSIYWSRDIGAHAVVGKIGQTYEALGGTTGRLGFPVGDRRSKGSLLVQDFEGGTLRQNAQGKVDQVPRPGSHDGRAREQDPYCAEVDQLDLSGRDNLTFRMVYQPGEASGIAMVSNSGCPIVVRVCDFNDHNRLISSQSLTRRGQRAHWWHENRTGQTQYFAVQVLYKWRGNWCTHIDGFVTRWQAKIVKYNFDDDYTRPDLTLTVISQKPRP